MDWYGKPKISTTPRYGFGDVFIEPKYSLVKSRKDVSTSLQLWGSTVDVPVISANMDTVTDGVMAAEMAKGGAVGAIHRFMTIEESVQEYQTFLKIIEAFNEEQRAFSDKEIENNCFVSIGTKNEERERFHALYDAGARWFIVDIAHGASYNMERMVDWLNEQRKTKPDFKIMGGNVATASTTRTLIEMGVDAVKVGIGPGAVCTTKNVTGVTVPQFSAIVDCVNAARAISKKTIVVADGGITEFGDIAKALGAGADMVMSGKLFAQTRSSITQRKFGTDDFGNIRYRGMASDEAMLYFQREDMPTAEGKSVMIESRNESARELVLQIKGALQSSFSYSNALNLDAFQKNCTFGVRYTP